MIHHPDAATMQRAITVALKGDANGDYRIGAVVADAEGVLAEAFTQLHTTNDPTAHAEILAIRAAAAEAGSRHLNGCYLYSTLEPCPMCTSAAIWSKVEGIVFGATLEDALTARHASSQFSWRQIRLRAEAVIREGTPQPRLHQGFMREQCVALLGPHAEPSLRRL